MNVSSVFENACEKSPYKKCYLKITNFQLCDGKVSLVLVLLWTI